VNERLSPWADVGVAASRPAGRWLALTGGVVERLRRVDVHGVGDDRWPGHTSGEALRVGGIGGEAHPVTSGKDIVSTAIVHVGGREERDATVLVFGVVPREELPPPREGIVDGGKLPGVARMILRGLELALPRTDCRC